MSKLRVSLAGLVVFLGLSWLAACGPVTNPGISTELSPAESLGWGIRQSPLTGLCYEIVVYGENGAGWLGMSEVDCSLSGVGWGDDYVGSAGK